MFSVKAEPTMGRLTVTINDYYDEEDLKSICFMIENEIAKVNKGFVAALDIRGMRVLEQKWTRYIKRIQNIMMDYSASSIATLADNVILRMQIQRLGKETGSAEITRQFTDEDEWRMYISLPPQLNKPHSPLN